MSKQMDFVSGLKLEHQSQLENPTLIQQNPKKAAGVGADPYWLTRDFHYAFDVLIPPRPVLNPSVSLRLQRLQFTFEEFQELMDACGFKFVHTDANGFEDTEFDQSRLAIEHIEGSRYDPVETADALGDINVVNNGMALELGLPMPFVNVEIFLSNMSKLGPDGNPVKNHCLRTDHACEISPEQCELPRPDLPRGKILKPDGYRKPNITRIIYDHLEEESN